MISTSRGPRRAQRSAARLKAVQALYQMEVADTAVEAAIAEFKRYRLGGEIEGAVLVEADDGLFDDIVRGLQSRRHEIDRHIDAALGDRPISRLDSVLRAILRAGAYELLARPDIPARAVINEYVDVAHAFFSGAPVSLANAVLDRLARDLRGTELEAANGGGAATAG